jgi:hypothetical protein
MATLIRLKQIESSSALTSASAIGAEFNDAVFEIIDGAGLISSSAQVNLVSASNYDGFVVQLDMTMSSDLETRVVSSSLAQTLGILSQTYVTTGSFNSYTQSFSSSVTTRVSDLEGFSSSLDSIFATDYEVYVTASHILDQGEF